jgi:hypothetical protein
MAQCALFPLLLPFQLISRWSHSIAVFIVNGLFKARRWSSLVLIVQWQCKYHAPPIVTESAAIPTLH